MTKATAGTPRVEIAWLIEVSHASNPRGFWCGGEHWNCDPLKAVRFQTKDAAEQTAQKIFGEFLWLCANSKIEICDHQFNLPRPPEESAVTELESEVAALTAERERLGEMDALLMGSLPLGMCTEGPTHALRNLIGRAGALQAELDAAKRALADAARYQFLKPLYTSIDFEYGDSSEGATPSIVFAIPPGTRWSGDLDKSIDAALAAKPTEPGGS